MSDMNDIIAELVVDLTSENMKLRAEVERLREIIKTIGARCVELDDREAVSAILDITEKVLEESKP